MQMKIVALSLILWSSNLPTIYARLGETLEQAESRYGKLKLSKSEFLGPDFLIAETYNNPIFSEIRLVFYKNPETGMTECWSISYEKETIGPGISLTPKNLGLLVAKNFPEQERSIMEMFCEEHPFTEKWEKRWFGSQGQAYAAFIYTSENKPRLLLKCDIYKLIKLIKKNTEDGIKKFQQERLKAMDAL